MGKDNAEAYGRRNSEEGLIWTQELRKKLEAGKKRHPFPTNHSLRKYFKTRCELAGMKPINIENLMGHSTGISDSYYHPTENDLLQDYLKYVDALTINDEKSLQKKVICSICQEFPNIHCINCNSKNVWLCV